MKVLAIVPARGGSKGIKFKNIRLFGKIPLISHTINIAKTSNVFDRIVVSTDHKQIQKIAESYGAEVPVLRPKKLSSSNTPIFNVVKHMLNYLENHDSYIPDIVVILQPTSPFRSIPMLKNCIKLLKNSRGSSVISVAKVKEHPDISFSKNGKYLKPLQKSFEKYTIRQTRTSLFHPTGSIYAFWTKNISKFNSIYGNKIIPYLIDKKEYNLDIDEPYDFFVGEMQLKFWSKYKIH